MIIRKRKPQSQQPAQSKIEAFKSTASVAQSGAQWLKERR